VLLKTGVVTGQELLAALEQTEAQVLRNPHRRRIRLIIIDSIANVFRCRQVQVSNATCANPCQPISRPSLQPS